MKMVKGKKFVNYSKGMMNGKEEKEKWSAQ